MLGRYPCLRGDVGFTREPQLLVKQWGGGGKVLLFDKTSFPPLDPLKSVA